MAKRVKAAGHMGLDALAPSKIRRVACPFCGDAHPELSGVPKVFLNLPLVVCPKCPPGVLYFCSSELEKWRKEKK